MDDDAPPLPPRNALSSDNLAPPALPPRQPSGRPRSTSDTTGGRASPFAHNDDTNADALATAYLQRHVREMKRTSVAGLARPLRQNYQVRNDDDVVQTNWKEYLEAWVQYIINSFASGQVDDKLEPFSLKVVKSGVDRLYGMAAPLKGPAMTVRRVYRWENRWLTGALALAYLILWYHDFLVPFGFAVCIGYIISIRLDLLAQFGVEALATAADTADQDQSSSSSSSQQQESKHTKQFWKRLRHDLGSSDLNYHFPALETKSMNEWRSDIQRKYGPRGQLLFMDMLDRLERVKNLLTWKRPEKTRMLLWLLTALALVLTFLPTRYMTKLVFLWIGIEFFVLQSLRSHYPRYRRLFNILDWLLWGVPNDAEYAMEVIRLHRQAEELMPQKESKNRPWRRSADLDKVPEENEKPAATSTAATLAIMIAGAAAGQVKHALDEQFERARLQDAKGHEDSDSSDGGGHSTALKASTSSNSLFERKTSRGNRSEEESEIHETYGCVYKGSIPGRILLTTNGLQFRTSRVTGAKILVYYYWQDIVSVRKSKSIDVFVWHTNGLDITTVDGEELHFDNVIKRDDCFNKLVAAAGDRWR